MQSRDTGVSKSPEDWEGTMRDDSEPPIGFEPTTYGLRNRAGEHESGGVSGACEADVTGRHDLPESALRPRAVRRERTRSRAKWKTGEGATQRPDGFNRAEYQALADAVQRCHNPKHRYFHRYGARGIAVCDEWRGRGGFDRFIAHIGPRPLPGLSLDRIDNDGNYEPGNVRWADARTQRRNQS